MGFFDYFDQCKTTDTNATDAGVPFSTEPHPFCFDDAGMPSCVKRRITPYHSRFLIPYQLSLNLSFLGTPIV